MECSHVPLVKRLVLDVLKAHSPDSLEFCQRLAEQGPNYRVQLTVVEVDENTQTTRIVVEAEDIDFERLRQTITELGASLHSIDQVEVVGMPAKSE